MGSSGYAAARHGFPLGRETRRVMLLSIDPGHSGSGAALWRADSGELVRAGYVRPGKSVDTLACRWRAMADALASWCRPVPTHALAIELPQVYRRGSKAPPGDIVQLAGLVGAIVGAIRGGDATLYYPHDWKGSVPKEVTEKRVLALLSTAELEILEAGLPAPSLCHNVFDAVGLGLHHLRKVRRAERAPV